MQACSTALSWTYTVATCLQLISASDVVLMQAWREITSRIESAMRELEQRSLPNKSQMSSVRKEGESPTEVAPKLPSKTD